MIHMVTSHGRTTPLVWTTVRKSTLKGWRNMHEDTLLKLFADLVPESVKTAVFLTADLATRSCTLCSQSWGSAT